MKNLSSYPFEDEKGQLFFENSGQNIDIYDEFIYTPGALESFLNAEEDKLIEDTYIEDTEPTIMQPEEKSKTNSISS